ncbi:MAG: primosomal protein N' [Candidatus Saccharimonadales bacterium]
MSKVYLEVTPIGKKGKSTLTYHADSAVAENSLVKIPFGSTTAYGMVTGRTAAPNFTTKAITALIDLPPIPDHTLPLAKWIANYYASELSDALRLLVPSRPDITSRTTELQTATDSQNHHLTTAQSRVIKTILGGSERSWLLHGVTGSGKTAVYIELCRQMLAQGQSAIVLVPEIALATQVIAEFERELGGQILITHSRMTAAQRRAVWRQALTANEPVTIIGPRSSLFLPRADLGLVIIDECHESSYKQEQSPNYHARDVAAKLCELVGAKLVLGSATPSTQDIFLSRAGRLQLLELPAPIHSNPRYVDIIDMRHQNAILSPTLVSALRDSLNNQQQSLLFLNRRGSASQVLCADCGSVATCPDCAVPQTWHGDSGTLQCHWCGRTNQLPASCPDCRSLHWRFVGFGTKRVETEVKKLFPSARVLRLDRDSFSHKTIKDTIKLLRQGEIDILIGTQMIAKGLDLPQVALVGVVLADTLLHIPDIYSGERTYQLLHQVIGRAGRRADQPARVVIQTYSPEHPAIKLASTQQFDEFIAGELVDRKSLGYPPYRYVLKLTCKRKTRAGAKSAATKLARTIAAAHPKVVIRGPAPSWQETAGGHWYWHLIITSPQRRQLSQIVPTLPSNWRADLDPIDLL